MMFWLLFVALIINAAVTNADQYVNFALKKLISNMNIIYIKTESISFKSKLIKNNN